MMENTQKYRLLLFPLTIVYAFIVMFRNRLFDFNILKSITFDIPVISIGNISIGGTGKTPHSEYIINLLEKDFYVALLSRGYGRKTKGVIIADENSTAYDIGDEPKQIKQKFKNITVAVDGNRVRGINKLMENTDLNVAILDDAYQHRYVKAGMNILLIDYNNPITDDYILPMGNMRESASERYRAHIIFITKTPENIKPIRRRIIEKDLNLYPYQSLYFTNFIYGNLINIFNKTEQELDSKLDVLVVTAIAKSKPLVTHLKEKTNSVKELKFRDHHIWTLSDFERIKNEFNDISSVNKLIITTEKDSVRFIDNTNIDTLKNIPIFYIPIKVNFLDLEHEKQFQKQVIDYVKKNKRSYRLYQK